MKNFIKLAASIAISLFAGAIGAIFTAPAIPGWYATLAKPVLNPPSWIFAPVWTGLYFLIGLALYLVWKNDWKIVRAIICDTCKTWNPYTQRLWSGDWQRANIQAVFAVQFILNIFWSLVFFGLRSPAGAFFVILALWFSIVYLIINFYRVSKAAGWLLAPYLLWVSFAVYLNFAIWMLN